VKRFRGGLVFKAHRLVHHSTLGLRVIKKKRVGTGAHSISSQEAFKASWKREFKLPWREAGPPNHHDDKLDSDQ